MRRRVLLTEALNKNRIRKNFASFFEEVNVEGLLDKVLFAINKLFIVLVSEFKDQLQLDESKITEDIINEIPTVYVERVLSDMKNYFIKNKENFDDALYFSILDTKNFSIHSFGIYNKNTNLVYKSVRAYSLLFFIRYALEKNGLMSKFSGKLATLESKVSVSGNYDIFEDVQEFIKEIKEFRNKKMISSMRNRKVYEDDEVEIYKVDDSREACITLGKGTDWCVANTKSDYYYKLYSSYGDMYAFVFKNIKSNFDPSLPEKALLTIKNRISGEKKLLGDISELVRVVKNGEYELSYKIVIDNYGLETNITNSFKNFVNDPLLEKYKTLLESFKNSIDDLFKVSVSKIINYMVKVYEDFFTKNVAAPPKMDLIGVYKNNQYDEFFDGIYQSFLKVYYDFLGKALDLKELENLFKTPEFDSFKELVNTLFQLKEKYFWILDYTGKDFLSIHPSIQFKSSDGSMKNVSFNDILNIVKDLFKYEIIFQDSGNNNINIFKPLTEKHQVIVRKLFDWPGLEKYLNIPPELFKLLSKTLNMKEHSINTIDDPVINFIKNDMELYFSSQNSPLKKYYHIFRNINSINKEIDNYFSRLIKTLEKRNTVTFPNFITGGFLTYSAAPATPHGLMLKLRELSNIERRPNLIFPIIVTNLKAKFAQNNVTDVLKILLDFESYVYITENAEELKQTLNEIRKTFYKNTLVSWMNTSTAFEGLKNTSSNEEVANVIKNVSKESISYAHKIGFQDNIFTYNYTLYNLIENFFIKYLFEFLIENFLKTE